MSRATHAGAFRVQFLAALTVLYVGFELLVTLWSTTVDTGVSPYIQRLLAKLWSKGLPTFVDYAFVRFTANMGFFVPAGFLLTLLLIRRLQWLAIVGGAPLSGAVETAQGLFLPARVSSLGDVAANTTGTVIDFVLAVAARSLILDRDTLVVRDVLEGRRASNGLRVSE